MFGALRAVGHESFAVNPAAEVQDGTPCYRDLASIPGGVAAVFVMTPPGATESTVLDCAHLGITPGWMFRTFGSGSASDAAIQAAGADPCSWIRRLGITFRYAPAVHIDYSPLSCCYRDRFSNPDFFPPIVATSVSGFLMSDYFKRSAWFRRGHVHTFGICSIATPDGPETPVFHVLKSLPRGYCVISPDECRLPECYFEERVVEEVRVENGIPEATEPPTHRRTP